MAVVDDQAPFRAAAWAVIGRTPGFDRWLRRGDGAQALALLADTAVDLGDGHQDAVLDGIAATGRIAVDHPDVVVFLLSSHDRSSIPARRHLAACGAAAFVPKEELSPRLLAELWAARVTRRGVGGPD